MLIQIKCQNCGSNIKVDNNNNKYICEHCGAEFITEETINNFKTVNQYSTTQNIVKNIYGKESMDVADIVKNGDVFVSLGEFDKAEKLYTQAINENPADWHGWFGMVKVKTKDFSDLDDISHCDFLIKAKKVANVEQKIEIDNLYKEYKYKIEQKQLMLEKQRQEEQSARLEKLKQLKIEEKIQNQKKKKKIFILGLFFVIAIISLIPFAIYAGIEKEKDLQLRNGLILEEKEDYYVVTGIEKFNENIIIPNSYKGKEVKEILPRAFANTNIKSIEIPNSVTNIGDNAFYACPIESAVLPTWAISCLPKYNLKTVVINAGISIDSSAFSNCTSLTSIEMPDSVTSIGDDAFNNCSLLKNVEIPNSVTSVGDNAFAWCEILQCNIKDELKYLGNSNNPYLYLVGNTSISITIANIDSGCKFIGEYAFRNCSSLTSVTIPNSVMSIGVGAFSGCSSLTSIVIGDSVTSIREYSFFNCISLTSIVIGDSVTSVDSSVFNGCHKLVEVVNRSPYISVEKGGMYGDIGVFALVIYNSDSEITESQLTDDNGYIIYTDGTEKILVNYMGNETDLTLPSYITQINKYAFSGCNTLKSVIIGENVTSIGDDAFSSCNSLTSVVIGDSVTSIGNYAFSNCNSLKSVVIGDSVESIGNKVFSGCNSLASITFEDVSTWYRISALDNNAIENWQNKKRGNSIDVTNASENATSFKYNYYWYKL